jgi:hypothetical protein
MKGHDMTMQTASVKISGIGALLMNNPQTVDRFNGFARRIATITAKGKRRTDEDYKELRQLEVNAKLYYDNTMGVYVPSSWLLESIVTNSFKLVKLGAAKARGGIFMTEQKCKLHYAGMEHVKAINDVVMNDEFHRVMNLPQGQVRLIKVCPSFQDWHFSTKIEFDDKVIDARAIADIVEYAAMYNGFGDFRPTFGRATGEVHHA